MYVSMCVSLCVCGYEWNDKGAAYYDRVIDCLIEHGIPPGMDISILILCVCTYLCLLHGHVCGRVCMRVLRMIMPLIV